MALQVTVRDTATQGPKWEYKRPGLVARVTDTIIEAIAPRVALQREQARRQISHLRHAGAYPNDYRDNRSPLSTGSGVTAKADRERRALMWNAIELIENSGLASSIRSKLINYICGTIRIQARTGVASINSQYEDYLRVMLGKRIDYAGQLTFRQQMGLGVGGQVVKGDFGLNIVREGPDLLFQGIESERIGHPYEWRATPTYFGGIELGAGNRRLAYNLYKRDPSSGMFAFDIRVPSHNQVGLPNFLFSINKLSFDEVRGISCFKTAINNIDYIERIREYELQALAWASSQSGVYYTNNGQLPSELPFDEQSNETDQFSNVLTRFSARPNTITAMGIAERVEMFNNERVHPNVLAMYRSTIRDIACGFNLSYGFVYDMSGLTGPGVRFHSSQDKRTIVAWRNDLSEDVLTPAITLTLGNGIAMGDIPFHPDFTNFGFLFPELPTIDVGRESQSGINEYLECLTTGADFVGEEGKSIDEIQRQKSAEIESLIQRAKEISSRQRIEDWREVFGFLRSGKAITMSPVFEGARAADLMDQVPSSDQQQRGATDDGKELP
jgi:capsid protein